MMLLIKVALLSTGIHFLLSNTQIGLTVFLCIHISEAKFTLPISYYHNSIAKGPNLNVIRLLQPSVMSDTKTAACSVTIALFARMK